MLILVLRDYAIVTIGVLTLLVASAAVYGILTINTQIQAKPEQIKIPDYSNELDSLKSQVSSMSSQIDSMSTSLTTLDTLKNNVADIQGKINDIENKNNQAVAQTVLTTTQLALVLDKSTYVPGDTIKLTAIGINPQKSVQVELLDNSDFILIHKETWSDSSGKLNYDLQLSNSLLQGNYKVQIVSDQQTQSQPITIAAQSSTQTVTGSSTFTAQTDKTVYSTGDLIQVTGVGPTGSSVSGIMTSPSGKTYSTATTIQADGSYVMIFSPSQPYETGQWNVSITNLGQTKTIPFSIGTGSSTGFYAFTAQTDKTVYQRGSLVQVTGTGQVSTSVTATMTSPSGKTYSTATTIRSDGTFSLVFSTLSADETGQWNISVANLAQAKTISVYLQ
jgi:hypothetical protein